MLETDKEFTKARNEELHNFTDFCCLWGRELLEQIERVKKQNGLTLVFESFVEHTRECSFCYSALSKASDKAVKSRPT